MKPAKSLSVFAATLLTTTMLVACSSPEQKMEKYTKSGQSFYEEGDFGRANLQFQNALAIDETHLPALDGLINIAEEEREYQRMFGLLQRKTRLQPDNVDALVKLGNIYLLTSDEAAAQDQVDQALAIDPSNVDAQALKASILFKIGDRANALRLANKIIAENPANQDAVTILVADKAARNDYEGALNEVRRGLARDGNHVLLQLMQIELLSQLNRPNEVDTAFKTLIAQNPEDPSFRQTYAHNLIRLKRYQDARKVLSEIVTLKPESNDARMNVIRIDYQLGGAQLAQNTFEAYANERPDDDELQLAFADFYKLENQPERAAEIYKKFANQKDDEALRNQAKTKLAAVYIADNKRDEAQTLIDEVLAVDASNTQALIARAGLKIDADQIDPAIIDLRTAIANNPDNTDALILMSAAFEKRGDIAFADTQLQQAFEKSSAMINVTNIYAKFLIRNQEPERAEIALQESLALYPDNIEGLRLLAAARLARQDWGGAQEAAKLIEAKSGEDPAIKRILGTASIGLQNYSEAINHLNAANEQVPLSALPLTTLVTAYIEENRQDEAMELLTGIAQDYPERYEARILLSQTEFSRENLDEGERHLKDAIKIDPEEIRAYDLLYRYYLRANRKPEAYQLIYSGLEEFPNNYALKVFEADILLNEARFDEAIAVYDELIKRRPDDVLVANNYASLLADNKTDEASLKRAVEVAKNLESVNNPLFQDTLGWAYFKAGELQNSLIILRRAVRDAPNIPVLRYHLGAAYLANGDKDDAREELNRALELAGNNFRYAAKVRELLQQI